MARDRFQNSDYASRPNPQVTGDLGLLALPRLTLVALTEEANARGLTVAQLVGHAISEYLVHNPVKEKRDGISE